MQETENGLHNYRQLTISAHLRLNMRITARCCGFLCGNIEKMTFEVNILSVKDIADRSSYASVCCPDNYQIWTGYLIGETCFDHFENNGQINQPRKEF